MSQDYFNAHEVANDIIKSFHPNQGVNIYLSLGSIINSDGEPVNKYAAPFSIEVQIQSESPTTLFHTDKIGDEQVTRRMYADSPKDLKSKLAGIVRSENRSGDIVEFIDEGTFWLMEGPIGDFSRARWQNIRIVKLVIPPDFTASDWWAE